MVSLVIRILISGTLLIIGLSTKRSSYHYRHQEKFISRKPYDFILILLRKIDSLPTQTILNLIEMITVKICEGALPRATGAYAAINKACETHEDPKPQYQASYRILHEGQH